MVTTSDAPGTTHSHRRHAGPQPVPRWERPGLALVLALAALLYSWGIGHAPVHPYYSAAVRSMAASWHAFAFGGLDPGGSITVDKIPGALWPQALAVRAFGPHAWAVALPQVLEGVLTVLVLNRVVRAWAGPAAALVAALVLTLTPVVVVLDRHSIPDTLLTLLLVCAAGALQKAVRTGRLLPLLICAAWVGLAFQAKMLQAWLVLPVFGAVYQLAAPGSRLARAARLALAGVVAFAVSCSWLLFVAATPAAHRPYLDGTRDNSPWAMVFGYNGLSRFSHSPHALGAVAGTKASRSTVDTGWAMLVNHTVGPQIAWFLPLAVLATVTGVWWRGRAPRQDPLRAGYLLWGGWLLVHALVFSVSNGNHGYYTVVLAPALAALTGAGLADFRTAHESGGPRRALLPAAIALTVLWAAVLDRPHSGFAPWLLPVALMLGLCGTLGLWVCGPKTPRRAVLGALAASLAAMLLVPAVWAASALDPRYAGSAMSPLAGPVGTAYQTMQHHEAHVQRIVLDDPTKRDAAILAYLTAHRAGAKYLVATQAAYTAEPLLRADPRPMLVMGGFTGLTPFPTAPQLAALVATHQVRYALLTPQRPTTPASAWVKAHCTHVLPRFYGRTSDTRFRLYDCHAGT